MVFQFQNVILFNKIGLKATELVTQHYHQVTVGPKKKLIALLRLTAAYLYSQVHSCCCSYWQQLLGVCIGKELRLKRVQRIFLKSVFEANL